MSEKNTSTRATDTDIHEFDDLEYNARKYFKQARGPSEIPKNPGNIHTAQKVVNIISGGPEFNLESMRLSEVRNWTNSSLQVATIKNRLLGKVPFDTATGKYNLSGYTKEQIRDIIATEPKPQPDRVESEFGGDAEKYMNALHQKMILDKRYRR